LGKHAILALSIIPATGHAPFDFSLANETVYRKVVTPIGGAFNSPIRYGARFLTVGYPNLELAAAQPSVSVTELTETGSIFAVTNLMYGRDGDVSSVIHPVVDFKKPRCRTISRV
jgi:hypothetical protein